MFTMKLKSTLATSLMAFSMASCAEAGPSADRDKAEIEGIVRAYLLENPEIIREALIVLEEREDRQSIIAVKDELLKDKRDFSVGPDNAKVTIVEFFDYNCGFCKQSTDWMQEVMKNHPNDVRVVFKELPILDRRTQTSRNAAKAALAAGRQGKYVDMHLALMDGTKLDEKFINAKAIEIGLDMFKFKKDMGDSALDEHIEDSMFLASRIPGLTGTPFFVINEQFLASGNTMALQAMLDEELSN